MRRGSAWTLLCLGIIGCSASGGDGGGIVVGNPNQPGGSGGSGTGGDTNVPTAGTSGDLFGGDDVGCRNGCAFSADPIFEAGVGPNDIAAFADAAAPTQPGTLCVLEPQLSSGTTPGALFPRNWLRPRFRWASNGGETLWEVRMKAEGQPDDLRAYTRDTQWLVPQEVWDRMGEIKTPITVTIRGTGAAGGTLTGVSGDFHVAPVDAGGSMVFWATTSSYVTKQPITSKLMGFTVGDEGVQEALSALDVNRVPQHIPGEDGAQPRGYYACGGAVSRPACTGQPTDPANCCNATGFTFGEVECVGCHVSTPDGKAVIFTDNWPWNKVAASIEPDTVGLLPATVTPYAANLLKQPWLGMNALSPAHFDPAVGGERILVTSYGVRPDPNTTPFYNQAPTRHELAWFDLTANDPLIPIPTEIPADPPLPGQIENIYQVQARRNEAVGNARGRFYGPLTTLGDAQGRSAVTPTWSNDGVDIAYVSTDLTSSDGHPDWRANEADIRVVNYAAARSAAGSQTIPLPGASDPNFLEYYPEYSVDDAFIAFARAPRPSVPTRCVPSQDANGVVTACPAQNLGENPDGPYYNRNGEIYVVPRAGSTTPIRLAANDPVSCSGETSRGAINSWPKWSPGQTQADGTVLPHQADGKTYYFLIFSSARAYPGSFEVPVARLTPAISPKSSQLYMAAIVVDQATGAVTTHPAVYLWNQNIVVGATGEAEIQGTSNLTPAWDDFSIPAVPDPIIIPR